MTKYLTGGLAAIVALLPALALAHPGHGAPAFHSHWEIAAAAAVALVSVAAISVAVLRRTRRK